MLPVNSACLGSDELLLQTATVSQYETSGRDVNKLLSVSAEENPVRLETYELWLQCFETLAEIHPNKSSHFLREITSRLPAEMQNNPRGGASFGDW